MKKVLIFGTFDILHPGHINFFKQAKEHGDHLICAVAHDRTVKEVKGKLPFNSQEKRVLGIQNANICEEVVAAPYSEDKTEIIRQINPDVVFLGYDQEEFVDQLNGMKNLKATILRGKPFEPEKYKSTILKKGL